MQTTAYLQAFAVSGADADFSCVEDGVELMDYLAEHSQSEAKRLPDLILLDLNMPRKDGRQALIEIKAEPTLQHIPIVILTTSEAQKVRVVPIHDETGRIVKWYGSNTHLHNLREVEEEVRGRQRNHFHPLFSGNSRIFVPGGRAKG
ncbi:hypothetical protein SBDP1_870044 [Syntrophobacter sp. SbD1]|nr:hypothetical protein SBDP1_870044 [Syntrophobacter sp. SbD1]